MPVLLVLLFVGVPLLEIAVILQVGAAIGGWLTAGILVVDSVVGAVLLRTEGRRAWSDFRTAMSEGRWPGDEVAQGALIIVGGTLLVTPGFVTDFVGFLLLVAPTRRLVARGVRQRVSASATTIGAGGPHGAATASGSAAGTDRTAGPGRRRNTRSGDRGPSSGRHRSDGPSSGGPSDGEPFQLDVEVVEIRREQGPRHLADGDGAEPVDPTEGDDATR